MSPLEPHWKQPSHPEIQEVFINEHEFTSKSMSRVTLAPFGLYAKMDFPPCNLTEKATYATVQFGKNKHLSLNSDLLYINHSCDPSLVSFTNHRLMWIAQSPTWLYITGRRSPQEMLIVERTVTWHKGETVP